VAISVRSVYNDVCNSILEPGGLTGEVLTDAEFLRILNDSLRNIFESSACFLKIIAIPESLGVRLYDYNYLVNQICVALSDEYNIHEGAGNYWDNSDYRWQQAGPGTPQEWRTDQLDGDQLEIRPAPAWNGYEVEYTEPFYGTFSESASPVTFDIDYDPTSSGMYGTISKTDLGSVYVEFTAPMYGTVANITENTLNISLLSSYTLENEIETLDEYIPDLPDMFEPYVKFAVLASVYAIDGETKNETLTKYYKKRTDELFGILRSVSGEILLQPVE